MSAVVPGRFDVTDVVRARRRTRPPTWLFVVGLAIGWVLDVVLVVVVVQLGLGVGIAVLAGILGYLLLPVPFVTGLREVWLRGHRDRATELDRLLGDEVPALQAWVDARVGEPVGLPSALATVWLLRPEPAGVGELLVLPPEAGWRVDGVALAARHDVVDDRILVRLAVLSDATVVSDGPEPPAPPGGSSGA